MVASSFRNFFEEHHNQQVAELLNEAALVDPNTYLHLCYNLHRSEYVFSNDDWEVKVRFTCREINDENIGTPREGNVFNENCINRIVDSLDAAFTEAALNIQMGAVVGTSAVEENGIEIPSITIEHDEILSYTLEFSRPYPSLKFLSQSQALRVSYVSN